MVGEMMKTVTAYFLPVEKIRRSPVNRVVGENDPSVVELAKNIQKVGLIQPITVRPMEDGAYYEIIAGERRWCAYRRLWVENPEMGKMAAFIREMSDAAAHELTVVENMQREDLSPIEEASGIQVLIQEGGYTVEEIADRLGKPVSWVAKRANLVKLTEKWREAMADPESVYARWTAGHLELVARYEAEVQDEIFGDFSHAWNAARTVKQLRVDLEKYSRKLSGAAWSTTSEGPAGTAACRACEKRSSVQPHLFEEEVKAKKGDHCLDQNCWTKNAVAYVVQKAAELKAEYPEMILFDRAGFNNRTLPEDSPLRKRTVETYNYEDAKKGSEGAIPALIIDGPGMGTVHWCRKKERYNGMGVSAPQYDANGDKLPKSMAERREGLEKRRNKALLERAREYLQEEVNEPKRVLRRSLIEMMRFVSISELPWPWDFDKKGRMERKGQVSFIIGDNSAVMIELDTIAIRLMRRALLSLQSDVGGALNGSCGPENAELTYWLLGLDVEAAREEIRGEIKEPKAWAELNEDGTKKRKKDGV